MDARPDRENAVNLGVVLTPQAQQDTDAVTDAARCVFSFPLGSICKKKKKKKKMYALMVL